MPSFSPKNGDVTLGSYEASVYTGGWEWDHADLSLFDFGRAGEGSNLEKLKLEFINNKRDKVYEYKVGTKIRNSEIYNELVNKRGGKHEGYFPEYR